MGLPPWKIFLVVTCVDIFASSFKDTCIKIFFGICFHTCCRDRMPRNSLRDLRPELFENERVTEDEFYDKDDGKGTRKIKWQESLESRVLIDNQAHWIYSVQYDVKLGITCIKNFNISSILSINFNKNHWKYLFSVSFLMNKMVA